MKIKAAVHREIDRPLSIEDVEIAEPGPEEVLVKTAACGVCHSDLHALHGGIPSPTPAVLGHEQAHCLARHAGERVSGGFLTSILARFVLLLDPTGVLYALFVPAAALLRELPHSRDQEIEADHIGLYLAAEACYDPRAAKRVFGRMKAGDGGSAATAVALRVSTGSARPGSPMCCSGCPCICCRQ